MSATAITFRGVTAIYQPHEQKLMRSLIEAGASVNELLFIHDLKAQFHGTLEEEGSRSVPGGGPAATPDALPSSSSVPTGHGQFQIPVGVQEKLRGDDRMGGKRERQ